MLTLALSITFICNQQNALATGGTDFAMYAGNTFDSTLLTKENIVLSAKAAVLMDLDTGRVLYGKNEHERLSMASTTKIMTCTLLLETIDNLDSEVVVTAEMLRGIEGSNMGLKVGDSVSYKALCYGLMLASGNDAANVIAFCVGGSLNGFAVMMNAKAKELGMNDTNFVTPSGLDSAMHYTTAYDFGLLTVYAMKNSAFKQIVMTKTVAVSFGNRKSTDANTKHWYTNHNKLLSTYKGCFGVKTGFTDKSGRCLVSVATQNGVSLAVVTLSDPNDWSDHKRLLDYGFNNLISTPLTYAGPDSLPVTGSNQNRISFNHNDLFCSLAQDEQQYISTQLSTPSFLYAPIKAGEEIGCIDVYYKNILIKQEPIYADISAPVFTNQNNNNFTKSLEELITAN